MLDLGSRMKTNYEDRARFYLTRRTPVIVRVDGRAFHTLAKRMKFRKPFDHFFIPAMFNAAEHVFREAHGCKLAYVQSDEASFLLIDYDSLDSDAWFDYNKSKVESLAASIMSVSFVHAMENLTGHTTDAVFDARAFNLPESEVANYFLWRAKDWQRNSLQMYARAFFSQKQLHKKNEQRMHEMLHQVGKNWTTDLTPQERNGTFIVLTQDGIRHRFDIEPHYSSVAPLCESVIPVKPVPK